MKKPDYSRCKRNISLGIIVLFTLALCGYAFRAEAYFIPKQEVVTFPPSSIPTPTAEPTVEVVPTEEPTADSEPVPDDEYVPDEIPADDPVPIDQPEDPPAEPDAPADNSSTDDSAFWDWITGVNESVDSGSTDNIDNDTGTDIGSSDETGGTASSTAAKVSGKKTVNSKCFSNHRLWLLIAIAVFVFLMWLLFLILFIIALAAGGKANPPKAENKATGGESKEVKS